MKITEKIVTSVTPPQQINVAWHNPETGELKIFGNKGWEVVGGKPGDDSGDSNSQCSGTCGGYPIVEYGSFIIDTPFSSSIEIGCVANTYTKIDNGINDVIITSDQACEFPQGSKVVLAKFDSDEITLGTGGYVFECAINGLIIYAPNDNTNYNYKYAVYGLGIMNVSSSIITLIGYTNDELQGSGTYSFLSIKNDTESAETLNCGWSEVSNYFISSDLMMGMRVAGAINNFEGKPFEIIDGIQFYTYDILCPLLLSGQIGDMYLIGTDPIIQQGTAIYGYESASEQIQIPLHAVFVCNTNPIETINTTKEYILDGVFTSMEFNMPVKWTNDTPPEFDGTTRYVISILDGVGCYTTNTIE